MTEKKKRRKKKEGTDDKENEGDSEEEIDEEMDVGEQDIKKLKLDTDNTDTKTEHESTGDSGEISETNTTETVSMETNEEDSVFKVTVGPQSSSSGMDSLNNGACSLPVNVFMPAPRMNALMVVKNGQLFMYGGIYEAGDRQYTLSDFYSIDVHKMDEWNIIIENDVKSQVRNKISISDHI